MAKKPKKIPLKKGTLTDEEKRQIELMIDFHTYSGIARKLNRNPATVRKYCQRNALTNDLPSLRRSIDNKAKNNHHFKILKNQLTPEEFDFAIQVYKTMNEQFGNDILYSEEIQIIEYCVVTCLLNRALTREMEIDNLIREQRVVRSELVIKKDEILSRKTDDEDEEAENLDLAEQISDKIDNVDVRIGELQEEHRNVKKDQISFFDRKEKITKALNVSRDQRAKELSQVNQNFGDFIVFLRKNQDFREGVGLEIEKMRIGVKEEYIRLTEPFIYADGREDYPIFNTEVASRDGQSKISN